MVKEETKPFSTQNIRLEECVSGYCIYKLLLYLQTLVQEKHMQTNFWLIQKFIWKSENTEEIVHYAINTKQKADTVTTSSEYAPEN